MNFAAAGERALRWTGSALLNRTVVGAGIGASLGFFSRNRDEDGDYTLARILGGAALGGLAGKLGPRVGKGLGNAAWGHFANMPSRYRHALDAGKSTFEALNSSFLSLPALTLAGGAIGYTYARSHGMDPKEGALYGMAGGLGAKILAGAGPWWMGSPTTPLGKAYHKTRRGVYATAASASILAYGVSTRDLSTTYAGSADPLTGELVSGQQISMNEPNRIAMSMRDRAAAIGAQGDLVFGLHAQRHGR